MQSTILLAGELGAGLGHVMPLYRIGEALHEAAEARGIDLRCVFAVHEPALLHDLKRSGDLVLQAPAGASQGELKSNTASYAEVLIANGFADAATLRRNVATWDDLFALVAPSLVIADHSPTAVLAARGRIATLVTGNGFTVPPAAIDIYPALLADRAAPAIQSALRDNVNALLTGRGLAPVARLPEFLKGDARAVFTIRELDPYGALRDTALAGLYEADISPVPLPAEPRIFLYGHAGIASFPMLVRASLETGLPVSAYVTGAGAELKYLLAGRGAEIFERPPPLSEILPRASLVVSNGGAGLSHAALIAGRPHAIAPIHAESQMTARALERMGCAAIVETATFDKAVAALKGAAENGMLRDACASAAKTLDATLPRTPLAALADACLDRIGAMPADAGDP